MIEQELDQIRKRCDKATPGPWVMAQQLPTSPSMTIWAGDGDIPVCDLSCHVLRGAEECILDGNFIRQAITDIPLLLDEVAEKNARLDELESLIHVMSIDSTALQAGAEIERGSIVKLLREHAHRRLDQAQEGRRPEFNEAGAVALWVFATHIESRGVTRGPLPISEANAEIGRLNRVIAEAIETLDDNGKSHLHMVRTSLAAAIEYRRPDTEKMS